MFLAIIIVDTLLEILGWSEFIFSYRTRAIFCCIYSISKLYEVHLKLNAFPVEDCVVCMESMKPYRTLACRHTFHEECIRSLYKCPLCRAVI